MSSNLSLIAKKHNQFLAILQKGGSLQPVWSSLEALSKHATDQKTQNIAANIIAACSCLRYPFKQNHESLPLWTRKAAINILLGEGDPFDKGCFGNALGQGRYGIVQKVTVGDSVFAAKRLTQPDGNMVNREYQLLVQFDHPNILKVMHATSDILYLEFAEKGCLNIQDFPGELGVVFVQIARGLDYLHKKQYVHRDIKLDNILVMKDRQIKIADLGLMIEVKAFKERKTGDFSSSFHLPPEHRFHKVKPKNCQKIDVWSFGYCISLFFLKKTASAFLSSMEEAEKFSGFTAVDLKTRFDVKKVKQLDSQGVFRDLLLKCFAYNPIDRPRMDQIVQVLESSSVKNA